MLLQKITWHGANWNLRFQGDSCFLCAAFFFKWKSQKKIPLENDQTSLKAPLCSRRSHKGVLIPKEIMLCWSWCHKTRMQKYLKYLTTWFLTIFEAKVRVLCYLAPTNHLFFFYSSQPPRRLPSCSTAAASSNKEFKTFAMRQSTCSILLYFNRVGFITPLTASVICCERGAFDPAHKESKVQYIMRWICWIQVSALYSLTPRIFMPLKFTNYKFGIFCWFFTILTIESFKNQKRQIFNAYRIHYKYVRIDTKWNEGLILYIGGLAS